MRISSIKIATERWYTPSLTSHPLSDITLFYLLLVLYCNICKHGVPLKILVKKFLKSAVVCVSFTDDKSFQLFYQLYDTQNDRMYALASRNADSCMSAV